VLDSNASGPFDVGSDLSVRADLRLDQVSEYHNARLFVRPSTAAPHGYQFSPGPLVATLDSYQAVAVHDVSHLEQDWWLPSRIIGGIDWTEPFDVTFDFGGDAEVTVADTTASEAGEVSVDWRVTDGNGHAFATVLATDVRPFVTLPEVVALENVEGLLRAQVPNELKPVLRLFDRTGTPLRAGSINWNAQPYTFTLDPETRDGRYRLVLESATGGFGGLVSDEARLQVGDPRPNLVLSDTRPAAGRLGSAMTYDVGVANTGTAGAEALTWQVQITRPGGVDRRDVELRVRIGDDWRRVDLRSDGSGGAIGTVTGGFTLAEEASRTWRVSLTLRDRTGDYTVTDRFTGTGIDVANSDTITISRSRGSYDRDALAAA
jgi:hypothetical protein